MESTARPARALQDVGDAGSTVEKQLPLVRKQSRAIMPDLLSDMSLVGKHAGKDRHVVMECILATHPHLAQRTACDMENQDLIGTG